MKRVLNIALFIFLCGCYSKEPENTGQEGKPLPSFNILLSDSTTLFNTINIPTGHPTVLFYFGPHCPYSKIQMEEIINNIKALKDINFYVFTSSSFSAMKSFVTYYQLNKYPNITAGIDLNYFFAPYFQVKGVPYIAIYGRDKRLNKAFIGQVYTAQIKSIALK